MMFNPSNTLVSDIVAYGLSEDEANIYLYTSKNGASTALKIAKDLHIDRARVYRLLDKLIVKGVVVQKMGERGFVFAAEPVDKFQMLIKEKETELYSLKEKLPVLTTQLEELASGSSDSSKVIYYQGEKGLQQVTWNSLKAEKDLRIIEVSSDMSAFLNPKFSEEVRQELVKRRIHVKQLTNLTELAEYTKVTELVTKYWTLKHVSPKDLKISSETLIYNDVVALYNIRGKDIFCVEIHDKRLATMQRSLFDFIWKYSKDMKIVNEFGKAVLG